MYVNHALLSFYVCQSRIHKCYGFNYLFQIYFFDKLLILSYNMYLLSSKQDKEVLQFSSVPILSNLL